MRNCPVCGSENYHFTSGWQGGEPIEPDEGYCKDCGFHYQEHCKDPLKNQIERFLKLKPGLVNGAAAIDCDEL